MKPVMTAAASSAAADEQLVDAAREGSDAAFEILFRRYRDRIAGQVRGMLYDETRTDDVVQETFISALRSLRATDQEIHFRPWIQQIARNACIDHIRRLRRADEVSIDSDEFGSSDERRLSQRSMTTEGAVGQRQDLDNLREAFDGLPGSQHRILVLRELEGLSYEEIGRRMDLTPSAVESMLSRARRSLRGQYDEIATGERCHRMRAVMAKVSEGLGGIRDRRTLTRHVRGCRPCRHEALALGLAELVAASRRPRPVRDSLARAAALIPLPGFLRRRAGEAEVASRSTTDHAQSAISHAHVLGGVAGEQTASVVQKAVAVVAAAAIAGGGGVVAQRAGVDLPLPKISSGGSSAATAAEMREARSGADGAGPPPESRGAPSSDDGSIVPGAAAGPGERGASALPQAGREVAPGATGPGQTPGAASPGTPEAPGAAGGGDGARTLVPDTPVGKAKGRDREDSSDTGSGSTDIGIPPADGGYRVPPGVQRAPGLGGELPPGILKKLPPAGSAEPAVIDGPKPKKIKTGDALSTLP